MELPTLVKLSTIVFGLLAAVAVTQAQKLRVLISVDMEGITGVVHSEQVTSPGPEYNLARKWMAGDVNAAVQGALDAGATEILVNDSHGSMRNVIMNDLHPAATLISGTPKPLGMMEGIDKSIDAVLFVGYHARAGTIDGVLDHTISSTTVSSITINGKELPELGINALVAGYFGVPVVFLSGDKTTCEQATALLGNKVTTATVKEAIGRYAAKNLSLEKAQQLIREQVKQALLKRNEVKPVTFTAPYTFELKYFRSSQADNAMAVPGVKRLDALTVQIESQDYLIGYKYLRALITLGRDN
jgi:D-amino peptidase